MNSRRFGLVMIVLSAVSLFLILGMRESMRTAQAVDAAPRVVDTRLPVIAEVTEFSLIDTNGAAFGLEDLKGKIWIADLIFTSCSGTCPTLSTNLRTVQETLGGDPAVHFVSISVDPDTDTPDQMARYAARMEADLNTWHFLTGPPEVVQRLAVEGFKVGSADEPIFHSNRFVLIDPQGRVRAYFMGTEAADLPRLIEAIADLKVEYGI